MIFLVDNQRPGLVMSNQTTRSITTTTRTLKNESMNNTNRFKGNVLLVQLMVMVVMFMLDVALSSILSRNVSNKVVYDV